MFDLEVAFSAEIMHGPKMHVAPTPTSKRPQKLMTCSFHGTGNHRTPLDVGVDTMFRETSLRNLPTLFEKGGISRGGRSARPHTPSTPPPRPKHNQDVDLFGRSREGLGDPWKN